MENSGKWKVEKSLYNNPKISEKEKRKKKNVEKNLRTYFKNKIQQCKILSHGGKDVSLSHPRIRHICSVMFIKTRKNSSGKENNLVR